MNSAKIAELERQIEDTRQELDRTLDALRYKFSPRHQLHQAARFTGRRLRAGACWSIDHPDRALLGAAAVTAALCFGIVKLSTGRRH
jgi:predicted NAD/FAD-binding protein